MTVHFGTDGWRGIMARDFTFAEVRRAASALAEYLAREGRTAKGVAVAYDRRLLSPQFAAEIAAVLAARDVPVRLASEPLPTPVLSWAVREEQLAAGVMVTASHNPPEWNGFKIKGPHGGPVDIAVTDAVETITASMKESPAVPPTLEQLLAGGRVTLLDPWEGYAASLRRLVDFDSLRRARLRAAVDVMHGCGGPWLPRALEAAGVEVETLRAESNPGFGGVPPEPTADRLPELMRRVAESGFHLGLATDGDADRIAAVDERGCYFSPQRILALFARYLWLRKGHRGGVAKAVSATSMLDLLGRRYGFPVHTVPIGFRHVSRLMMERPIFLGGEESGAIGIGAHLPERDGIANALLLAEIVAVSGRGLRACIQEVFDEVGHFTYDRVDIRVPSERMEEIRLRAASLESPTRLCGRAVTATDRTDGTKFLRDDSSWLLLRVSGTEPFVRVYAEAATREEALDLLAEGRRLLDV